MHKLLFRTTNIKSHLPGIYISDRRPNVPTVIGPATEAKNPIGLEVGSCHRLTPHMLNTLSIALPLAGSFPYPRAIDVITTSQF